MEAIACNFRFCGQRSIGPYITFSRSITLIFHTDDAIANDGFEVHVLQLPQENRVLQLCKCAQKCLEAELLL